MQFDFKDGRYMLGDCFDRMREIPDASVDMVLCDLPYGMTRNKWDTVLPFDALWREYWRIAKPSAPIVLTAMQPFASVLGASCIERLKYEWIWDKPNPTGFLNATRAPMRSHENILVFYRSAPTYNPIKTTGHPRKMVKRTKNGSNYGGGSLTEYDSTERFPRDIINVTNAHKLTNWHPTQKPVALFEYLIRTYTNPGETVLDNCAGSGTTAKACMASGRRFICIERDQDYFLRATADLLSYGA